MSRIEEKFLLRCKNRQFLPDVVPLAVPFVLFIEPTNICNFECAFCPTGNKELLRQVNRRNMFMQLELFKKIVDDLKEFPDKLKLINLWKDGESLLHPEFPEMCEYLGKAGVAEKIKIRTNGTLLEKELNRRLIASGVSEIGISVEAVSDEKYFALTKRKVSYKKLVSQVRELYRMREGCKIFVKIVDVDLSDDEKERFYNDFDEISDICVIEHLMGWSGENGENFKMGRNNGLGQDGNKLNQIDVCTLPFTCMGISITSSTHFASSYLGHASYAMVVS